MHVQSADSCNSNDGSGAAVAIRGEACAEANASGKYTVTCRGPAPADQNRYLKLTAEAAHLVSCGQFAKGRDVIAEAEALVIDKWAAPIDNLVTTSGKNFLLDNGLGGTGYTAAFYVLLLDGATTPTLNAADTMASHAGWTENVAYSNSTRIAAAWSAAASGAKALSSALGFSINANTQTIAGCGLATVSTKSGTTGTLYSIGTFTGGNKAVNSGDTLNVSYTASL